MDKDHTDPSLSYMRWDKLFRNYYLTLDKQFCLTEESKRDKQPERI